MRPKKVLLLLMFSVLFVVSRSMHAQPILNPVQQVSPDNLTDVEEVSVVINPLHPEIIAAGSNPGNFYYSTNHGQTWFGDGFTSASYGDAGDPSLTADSKGNIYFAHLGYPPSTYWLDRVVIQKSIDSGKTYSDGTFTGHIPPKQQDKETIVCDNSVSSPYHDNLYMSWTEFDMYQSPFPQLDSSRILFSRSIDAGETWSDPIIVSDRQGDCADSSNTVEGATCATAPNGDIYITWSGHDGLVFDKSTDGGKTFGKDRIISSLTPGWDFPVAGLSRCNGLATTLCDISHSIHRGNVYVVFSDKRNGVKNTDVFLLRSRDGGSTWDPAVRVNNDTTQYEQFMPAATVDPVTGIIYCVFYDRRNTNGGTLTDMYLARSVDGGSTFANYRLTENPFAANPAIFFGDYIGIAALNANVYPIWMQVVQKTTALYTSRVRDTGAFNESDVRPLRADRENPASLSISPNPASGLMHFHLTNIPTGTCSVTITDVMGREIAAIFEGTPESAEQQFSFNANRLPNGVYYCILQTGEVRSVRKFIVSH